jgi:hypothetical protein
VVTRADRLGQASSRLRRVASRSAALLREVTHPARVLAWLCPRCGEWVPPKEFSVTAGLCRCCQQQLDEKGA